MKRFTLVLSLLVGSAFAQITLSPGSSIVIQAGQGTGSPFTPGGDLGGNSSAQTVIGILGQPLPSLTAGYPHWNGTAWVFDNPATGSMTWPGAAGIAVYAGSNTWGTSLPAPSSAVVGITDAQTLTNKTVNGVSPTIFSYLPNITSDVQAQLNALVPVSRTINGYTLTSNITIKASDITSGNLPLAQMPSGPVWPSSGTVVVVSQLPTTLPPSGPAGGVLNGTYPNPSALAATGVTAGSYTNSNLTVGADGRIVTVASGSNAAGSLPLTFGATGTTVCDRFNNQAASFPAQEIDGRSDGVGTLLDCGNIDLDSPNSVFDMAGHTVYRTVAGWTIGNRQIIRGESVGLGGTSVTSNTGTNYVTTSSFPTGQAGGGGITATGTSGSSTISFALAAGTYNIQLKPGSTFFLPGDATEYMIGNCTSSSSPPCANASNSIFYALNQGAAAITVNIKPNLASNPSGAAVLLMAPIFDLADSSATSGSAEQVTQLLNGFINGDSANNTTGNAIGLLAAGTCQENCGAENIYIRNATVGFRLMYAHRSFFRNINVANVTTCSTPGNGSPATIPVDLAPLLTIIQSITVYADACTPAQMPYGAISIRNNPIGTVSNGSLYVPEWHVEMNGTTTTGDAVQLGASAGSYVFGVGTACPTAWKCKNAYHILSTFGGTLHTEGLTINSGTTNYVQDDLNGNTFPAAAVTNGSGYYDIIPGGTAVTTLPCAYMTKGWCWNGEEFDYYLAGVAHHGFDSLGDLLSVKVTASGASVFSGNGGSGVPALSLTGSLFTGGTGTTTVPQFGVQPSVATNVSTWSTSGTVLGMNPASGFAGNFLDFHVNGGSSLFSVAASGALTSAASLTAQSAILGSAAGAAGIVDKSAGLLSSGMTLQTSATCTNITNMTWNLAASKNYMLRCTIPVTFASSATVQFCLAGPGSPTSYSLIDEGPLGASAAYGQFSTLGQSSWGTKTSASGAPGVVTEVADVKAMIQNGSTASGTALTLQTAANGTNGITVGANAECELHQLN